MAVLTREQIVKCDDLEKEVVTIDVWGGDVILRTMTGAERDAYEDSLFETKGNNRKVNYNNMRAKLVARCLIDETGNRMFNDKEIAALGEKNSKALDKLYTVAARLNGIGPAEEEALVKNSEGEENDTSTSSLPKNSE